MQAEGHFRLSYSAHVLLFLKQQSCENDITSHQFRGFLIRDFSLIFYSSLLIVHFILLISRFQILFSRSIGIWRLQQ
jgi:hypothetical protein